MRLIILLLVILFICSNSVFSENCADFNSGASRSAHAGIRETFSCPRDGVALHRCNYQYSNHIKVHEMEHRNIGENDIVLFILMPKQDSKSMNIDALLWWTQYVTSALDIVIIAEPLKNDMDLHNDAAFIISERIIEHQKLLGNTYIVRPDSVDVRQSESARRALLLLEGMKKGFKMYPNKRYYIKIDLDSILFPKRLFSFLSTLSTVTNSDEQPLYFGTIRDHSSDSIEGSSNVVNSERGAYHGRLTCFKSRNGEGFDGLCYANGNAAFGLNLLAMKTIYKAIVTLSSDDDISSSDVSSAAEFIGSSLYSKFGLNGTVIHCGSFGSSDLISDENIFKQSIAFHYVDSEWLTLHREKLFSHYNFSISSELDRLERDSFIPKTHPFHNSFVPANGDNGGLKVLVVSVDNRDVTVDYNGADYYSLTAVLQKAYADSQGYDFIRIKNENRHLMAGVQRKYFYKSDPFMKNAPSENDPKYGSALFHPGYRYFRASSWGKLPALWYLTSTIGHRYDYIWFMDSDAAPNPMQSDKSVSDALERWQRRHNKMVVRGSHEIYNSTFLFFSNFPWRDDMPCAGSIIFKPREAEFALREWWDFDIPSKNLNDFMEQDALWYMLEADHKLNFSISESTVTVLKEPQFPSAWHGVSEMPFVHIANYDNNRRAYFRTMLKVIGMASEKSYRKTAKNINRHFSFHINVLKTAEAMEKLHRQYRKADQYPVFYEGKDDELFHSKNSLKEDVYKRKVPAQLYEGFVVRLQSEGHFHLVCNGTRRGFGDVWNFLDLGFDFGMILVFKDSSRKHDAFWSFLDITSIPFGPDIPRTNFSYQFSENYVVSHNDN